MSVTPEELSRVYPLLYHMADADSWEGIQRHGLLSTSALLDLFKKTGKERERIESQRRPENVPITCAEHGRAVIRDQKSIIESKLAKALEHCHYNPPEWYKLLNKHVFFWLTKQRLQTLLSARAYRNQPHLVLTVETLPLAKRYQNRIFLSPMNSGNTQPFAHPRCPAIFKKMGDYPFEARAKYGEQYQVVELAVETRVNLGGILLSADFMKSDGSNMQILKNIFPR